MYHVAVEADRASISSLGLQVERCEVECNVHGVYAWGSLASARMHQAELEGMYEADCDIWLITDDACWSEDEQAYDSFVRERDVTPDRLQLVA